MIPSVLVAYPYFDDTVAQGLRSLPKGSVNLLIDSGAFTAHSLGMNITVDEYCHFLDGIADLQPFRAVQLDVIGDHDQTLKNFYTMRQRGFDVMPVFTRGSPAELLEELYSVTDYLLLGGVAGGQGNKAYCNYFNSICRGRKAHWLGFTNIDFIKAYRPTSVDASSWMATSRFGGLQLYEGFGRLSVTPPAKVGPIPTTKQLEAIRRIGYTEADWMELRKREKWGGVTGLASTIGVKSNIVRAMDMERHLGTKFYFSSPNWQWLAFLLRCWQDIEAHQQTQRTSR